MDIVIVAAKRTPMGAFQGALANLTAPELGACAIAAAIAQAGLKGEQIDEAYMGNVLSAGVGQAPARQAVLKAGLPESVPCTTVNKVCGSGMKAVMLAADSLRLGDTDIVIAGGMESMSRAPYLLDKARSGFRMGHQSVLDHMFLDGLQDAYEGQLMGHYAQLSADRAGLARSDMDAFAIASLTRALAAQQSGAFKAELAQVTVGDTLLLAEDEQPAKARPDKIPHLKPAFSKQGTITAANASSISDGAAAQLGLPVLAHLVGYQSHAAAPAEFTNAPIGAINALLSKIDWRAEEVDLFEINEAFAMVSMLAMAGCNLPHDKVNVNGGACALGHPLGASGARILVTLIHALHARSLKRGVASLCIGGGEATAVAIELS
ncbi:TPA: acetyl-CoA C-acyltransferase [Aeromonas salmonicida]|uniref:acetyl-CoA C-acyltransferase n=1 Tax=Aeromonas salmonicida TaxID=645 RepID=UPI00044F5158|nr:acetyl-CoA C-acyltransferase [Aeromonas salmonicida]ELI6405943.1 acetyl-CoA C-acyltransferase [Aeromonas salmonicida subsp. salmonicida]ASI23477.1 acetyl-CoA acetyltransferase [Aeromonas salmonicida]ASI27793.1 acetyl-CoA acetyltransferase [Aeromonas salmonicida]ASI31924.1 acetyl-CoA acetyltransferase [Aeromonas salmonicida]ATD38980.1 acetyl-CoA acetyltransferase [Aeromonas salmonicida subsp. masoucida]